MYSKYKNCTSTCSKCANYQITMHLCQILHVWMTILSLVRYLSFPWNMFLVTNELLFRFLLKVAWITHPVHSMAKTNFFKYDKPVTLSFKLVSSTPGFRSTLSTFLTSSCNPTLCPFSLYSSLSFPILCPFFLISSSTFPPLCSFLPFLILIFPSPLAFLPISS